LIVIKTVKQFNNKAIQQINQMKKITFYTLISCLFLMTACEPSIEDKIDIGLPPQADFSIEYIDANNVKLINTTIDDNFIASWDLGSFGVRTGNEVVLSFPEMGEYFVTLSVFGKGGSGDVTKAITITQNVTGSCGGAMEFISACGTKTWKLNPAAGALWVGPNDGSGTTWWQNSDVEVTGRPCDWNDEYTFTEAGVYTYNSNGDLWGETYMGFSADACYPITDLPADRADWSDGVHAFEVTDGAIPKLKVTGNGAFLGLRKPTNGMEVTLPQAETIYDVIRMETVSSKDILELEVDYGGGIWRFTLVSQ
jgi:hypothetical protein